MCNNSIPAVHKRWTVAGLSLVVLVGVCRVGSAQERYVETLPTAQEGYVETSLPIPPVQGTEVGQPFPSIEFPTEEPAAPAAPEKKPFWATHPQVTPTPRTGWFLIAPTGPGYYSVKDVILDEYREGPPKFPYAPVSPIINSFFDADYRYLDDPKNTQFDWVDPIKRIHCGDCWLLSFGGEERLQYKNEIDSRLTTRKNEYELNRLRLYGDLWYSDVFRVYIEFIDAQSFNQTLPPLAIDKNKGDFLNLFTDIKLLDINDHGWYVRGGRQELLYGSQRLISPLDWANTRRTFEGVKTFWHGDKLDVDLFWVQPVNIAPSKLDSPDHGRNFVGAWTTYRPVKGQSIDAYYLYLDQSRPSSLPVPPGSRGGFNCNTIGSRYAGDSHNVLWDFEGMWQFGSIQDQSISAGAVTTGAGYHFKDCPMNPIFWFYNDYASGDDSGGRGGTFNQLFPFGHFYFGFLDLVARQNIDDVNMQFSLHPTKWITTLVQGHFFYLDSTRDALFSAGGAVERRDPTNSSGHHIGNELDWIINFHLSQHQDILVGYSKFYAGEFIAKSRAPGAAVPGPLVSPELFYVQYSFKW